MPTDINPYLPPSSSFESAPVQQPDSKWLYVIAVFFGLPLLAIGGFGVIDEIIERRDVEPFEGLFGLAVAGGILLGGSAPFVLRLFAKKYWQRLDAHNLKRLFLLAYLYALPFAISGFFRLSRPEAETSAGLMLIVVMALSVFFAFGVFCWFLLMYGLMAWRLRRVARSA